MARWKPPHLEVTFPSRGGGAPSLDAGAPTMATDVDWLTALHGGQRTGSPPQRTDPRSGAGAASSTVPPDPALADPSFARLRETLRESGQRDGPSFSRTKSAAARAWGDAEPTWDRMLRPDLDRPRDAGWRRWLTAFRGSRRSDPCSLPDDRAVCPLLSAATPAGDPGTVSSPERGAAVMAAAEDEGRRGGVLPHPRPSAARPLHLRPPERPVRYRLVEPLTVTFPAIFTMRSMVLPRAYLQALHRLVRPAVDAGRRTLRSAVPALPAPGARLALSPPDPTDPLRRQLPVPVPVRPLVLVPSLVPSLAAWLPPAWREPHRPPFPPPPRRGTGHSLATLAAALALTTCTPLLLSSERISERIEPALGLLMGHTPGSAQHREIVLFRPESGTPSGAAPATVANGARAAVQGATPERPTATEAGDAMADLGSGSAPVRLPPPSDDAGSWSSLYQLGHSLWSAGKVEDAITALTGASELNPEHPAIAYDLGWALQRAGRADEAILHYRRAIELRPDNAFANYNLGFLLKERGRDDEAAGLLGRAVELLPGNPYAAFDYAALLERQGALVAAAEMYLRAKQNAGGTALAADANRRLDKVEEALKERSRS